VAKDFPSEEALKDYLHDHPKADPGHHKVVENDRGPAQEDEPSEKTPKLKEQPKKKKPKVVLPPPQGGGKGKEKAVLPQPEKEPKKKPSFKDRFKGLTDKAAKFAKTLGSDSQKFLQDDGFRKQVLKEAVSAIAKAPKAYAKNLVKVAKHEKEHFTEAMHGVKAVIKGGKMSPEQKKAFKTVATHMAITAAAAAFTGGSAIAIAGAFGKGIGRQVAVKAVLEALENLHLLDEVGHVGHGLVDLLHKVAEDKEEAGPEDKLAMLIMALVTKHIDQLDDDMIKQALEEAAADEGTKEAAMSMRVAARYQKLAGGYYDDFVSIEDTARRWEENGEKLYDTAMPVMLTVADLWRYREYTWSREDSRDGPEYWDELAKQMRQGWKRSDPAHVQVGRQGGIKVSEGNHRLAIAKDLRIRKIPVWIHFYSGRV